MTTTTEATAVGQDYEGRRVNIRLYYGAQYATKDHPKPTRLRWHVEVMELGGRLGTSREYAETKEAVREFEKECKKFKAIPRYLGSRTNL